MTVTILISIDLILEKLASPSSENDRILDAINHSVSQLFLEQDSMSDQQHGEGKLEIYHAGSVTVVGFGGRRVETRIDFAPYRDVLTKLVNKHQCHVLAIDLRGVVLAPAGLLGVLVPIRKLVDRIELHNPSDSARRTLETIQRGSLFDICDLIA